MTSTTPNSARSFQEFPCSQCGGKLEFNPKAGRLKCIYCSHEEDISQDQDDVQEISYDDFLSTKKVKTVLLSETALEVACPSCHAHVTFEPPDVAGKCPFCGTSIVSKGEKAHPVVEPGGVIPCKVTQKNAQTNVRKWLGNNWFLPSSLKELAQQEGIQGVYLPFWTYDAQTESDYTGSRGEYYYTIESYPVTNSEGETEWQTRQVQHTRWYPVAGHVSQFFDDILIPATKQLDDKQLKKLSGWNLKQLLPYSPSYLAGFKAQRYQVPLEMGLVKAKEEMRSQLNRTVSNDIGGDTQTVSSINTQHNNVTFKHIMLPVWISAYRYQNKQYRVMVNAQTGKVSGDRPYSKVKIAIAVVAGLSILIGGFLLFSNAYNSKNRGRTYRKTYRMGTLITPIQSLVANKHPDISRYISSGHS
jgi:predicted RNA-binding Zn-ribbon protein involved in translation (DUF1610 family)